MAIGISESNTNLRMIERKPDDDACRAGRQDSIPYTNIDPELKSPASF
jgi:hypothetical protein